MEKFGNNELEKLNLFNHFLSKERTFQNAYFSVIYLLRRNAERSSGLLAGNKKMKPMRIKSIAFLLLLIVFRFPLYGQLKLGGSQSEINFRESPGLNSKVLSTVSSSNLLVILPGEPQNGYVEVFDIESSSFGFVYESLIKVTDTLYFQKQHFFERSGENENGDITIEMINRTDHSLFIWINKNIFNLAPHEKKELIFKDEEITYFSSAPGLYPVFGREILKKGNSYKWDFTL